MWKKLDRCIQRHQQEWHQVLARSGIGWESMSSRGATQPEGSPVHCRCPCFLMRRVEISVAIAPQKVDSVLCSAFPRASSNLVWAPDTSAVGAKLLCVLDDSVGESSLLIHLYSLILVSVSWPHENGTGTCNGMLKTGFLIYGFWKTWKQFPIFNRVFHSHLRSF